jgi:hypothetical protein
MTHEKDVTCPLHEGLPGNVEVLFSKVDRLLEKIFWIMLIQVVTAFLVGGMSC